MVPERTWMIGNSPKSDVNPALEAGLNAVFVPARAYLGAGKAADPPRSRKAAGSGPASRPRNTLNPMHATESCGISLTSIPGVGTQTSISPCRVVGTRVGRQVRRGGVEFARRFSLRLRCHQLLCSPVIPNFSARLTNLQAGYRQCPTSPPGIRLTVGRSGSVDGSSRLQGGSCMSNTRRRLATLSLILAAGVCSGHYCHRRGRRPVGFVSSVGFRHVHQRRHQRPDAPRCPTAEGRYCP